MKIFISQPMSGREWHEVLDERVKIYDWAVNNFGEDNVEILDTIFDLGDVHPLMYIAKSIEKLAEAEIVLVAPGWELSRGCKIEVDCALMYHIENVIFLTNDNLDGEYPDDKLF